VNKSQTKFKVSTFVILYLEMCDGMNGAVYGNCWSVRQLVGVFGMKASRDATKPMKLKLHEAEASEVHGG